MNLRPLKLYHGLFGPTVGPTMLELLRPCWQWCANGCNNSQQCWPITHVGLSREVIVLLSIRRSCVMIVPGPKNVGKAVETDPTLLLYASAIMEQKKCIEFLAQKFARFQTLRNNSQQHATTCNRLYKRTQHVTSNNVATVCAGL